MTTLITDILNLLQPIANTMGLNIGHINLFGKQVTTVQIFLEKSNQQPVSLNDCSTFTKQARVVMDVNNVCDGNYKLEVSSFGIDRPLLKPEDYVNFAGKEVVIKTKQPIDNVKKFAGVLQGVSNCMVQVLVNNNMVEIALVNIDKANLDLIKNININKL